jgi:DUF1016 N-terminal domain
MLGKKKHLIKRIVLENSIAQWLEQVEKSLDRAVKTLLKCQRPMNDQLQPQFTEILDLIKNTQNYVIVTSNQELIKLYWSIGKYIDDRLKATEWGKKTVQQLADFIQAKEPGIKGFERRNLERMRQFYKIYPGSTIASALLTQLSWTHHCILMSRCKTDVILVIA